MNRVSSSTVRASTMVIVSRTVHIHAPVERVFALVSDPAARSALSPNMRCLRAEIEGGGPLRAGSVCHFRQQAGDRIVDYRTRVLEFEPPRRIVSVSESAVPFTVRIETEPDPAGTQLTQTETFEPTEAMIEQALPPTTANAVLQLAYRIMLLLDLDSAQRLREQREQALARSLEPAMERWLAAIKSRLETG